MGQCPTGLGDTEEAHLSLALPLAPLHSVAVITAMSGSMGTASGSLRRWPRPSVNGTVGSAEVRPGRGQGRQVGSKR